MWNKGILVPTNYEKEFNQEEGVGDVKGKYSYYGPSNETQENQITLPKPKKMLCYSRI